MAIIKIGDYDVEIDDELVPLIKALNKAGLRTTNCCAGHGKYDAYVSIALDNIKDIAIRRDGEYGHRLVIWWNPVLRRQNNKEVVHGEVD